MLSRTSFLMVAAFMCLFAAEAVADVPRIISYQGRLLSTSGTPYDGSKLVKFTIYDGASAAVWNSGFISVTFNNGLCAVKLGESPQPALPTSNWTSDTGLTLGITVDVDPEIAPRTRFTTVGYAMHAKNSETASSAPWGGITGVPAGFADGVDDAGASYSPGSGLQLVGTVFSIPTGGVISSHISDGTIADADINAAANIAPTKISGTAAILSGDNVFTGSSNQFQNDLRVNGNIGIRSTTAYDRIVNLVPPDLATTAFRMGYYTLVTNSSTGDIYGTTSGALSTTAGSGGNNIGVLGEGRTDGSSRTGVYGIGQATTFGITTGFSYGLYGFAVSGATAYGVYGSAGSATTNWAGYFNGNANVTGTLTKGGGAFRIDHPLDPENKILQHSFVESPDMMNVYNGNSVLDSKGEALVTLPTYFEALNKDFRYQLTCVGEFAPVFVKTKIVNNSFTIGGGKLGVEVSWQVTGIRQDKWAEANRIQVEVDKLPDQKGLYLHAAEYGLPVDKSVDREQIREAEKHRAERDTQQPE